MQRSQKLSLTVKAASEMLGVCAATLRNWDRCGKLKSHRHPINGYRLYDLEKIEALRRKILGESRKDRR